MKSNTDKSCKIIETLVEKLRTKFKSFKQDWLKTHSCIKYGFGFSPENGLH